jgi:non-ribosomal peptide synthetase component F
MTLWVTEDGNRLCAQMEYNVDLFDADTIDQMLDHFENLLRSVVENPGQRLLDIPLEEEPSVDNDYLATLSGTDDFLFTM